MVEVEEREEYIKAISTARENKDNAFDKFIYEKMDNNLDVYLDKVKEINKTKAQNKALER